LAQVVNQAAGVALLTPLGMAGVETATLNDESSGSLVAKECSGATWTIKKFIYRHLQQDGSVVQRITYHCPVQGCCEEFADMMTLSDHVEDGHGVPMGPKGGKLGGAGLSIRVVCLPNGEFRQLCPFCMMQFPMSAKQELFKHAAEEHGEVCTAKGGELHGQSEHLDLCYMAPSEAWHPRRDEVRKRLHVVSLGSFCGMKLSMQRLGLGEAHLPFDWIRTTSAGVRHFIRSRFQGFFRIAGKCDVPNTHMTMYRSELHSFWHDDITKQEVREKMWRRIDRLLALRDSSRDLLFVRSCASTDELAEVEDLYSALVDVFSATQKRILLAVVAGEQDVFQGPILHQGLPGVAFFGEAVGNSAPTGGPIFCRTLAAACNAALEAPQGCSPGAGFGLEADGRHPSVPCGAALIGGEDQWQGYPRVKCSHSGLYAGFGDLTNFATPGSQLFDLDA